MENKEMKYCWVYVDYREEKGGEIEFSTPEVLPMGVEVLQRHNYEIRVISNQKYNLFLKTIQGLAGIQTNLTTHLARKTFCCLLLNKGVSINTVAKCAGHNDIKITRSYYATLQEATVIQEVKQAMGLVIA